MFEQSKLKVERAEKHIRELSDFVQAFPNRPDFHSVSIEHEIRHVGESTFSWNYLTVTIRGLKGEFLNETALIIGDVYHNLRSALDILWYEIVFPTALQTDWTRFPIEDTCEELRRHLNTALKKGQISQAVHGFVLNTIKPYREDNFRLWSVHKMNIIDKHQLLIPTFPMMALEGMRIRDGQDTREFPVIFFDAPFFRRRLSEEDFGHNPELHDKGHIAIGQGFHLATVHAGQPVIPTLNAVAEEVTRTIRAFELLQTTAKS